MCIYIYINIYIYIYVFGVLLGVSKGYIKEEGEQIKRPPAFIRFGD